MSHKKKGNKTNSKTVVLIRQPRGGLLPCEDMPPPIQAPWSLWNYKIRYQVASSTVTTASPSQIASWFCMCTVAGAPATYTRYVNAIRVRKVRLWCGPGNAAGSNTPVTVSLQFNGNLAQVVGPNKTYTDTSIGVTRVARLCVAPPADSTASEWLPITSVAPGTSPLFTYTAPIGTILMINLDATSNIDDVSLPTVTGVNAGVLGQTYSLALDHGVADNVIPISVNTNS